MVIVQAKVLLHKLRRRDRVKKFHRPVLEDLCLRGCMIDEIGITHLNQTHPDILLHTKQPTALASKYMGGE